MIRVPDLKCLPKDVRKTHMLPSLSALGKASDHISAVIDSPNFLKKLDSISMRFLQSLVVLSSWPTVLCAREINNAESTCWLCESHTWPSAQTLSWGIGWGNEPTQGVLAHWTCNVINNKKHFAKLLRAAPRNEHCVQCLGLMQLSMAAMLASGLAWQHTTTKQIYKEPRCDMLAFGKAYKACPRSRRLAPRRPMSYQNNEAESIF